MLPAVIKFSWNGAPPPVRRSTTWNCRSTT